MVHNNTGLHANMNYIVLLIGLGISFGLASGPLKKGSFNTYYCWEVKGWRGVGGDHIYTMPCSSDTSF